MNLQGKIDKVLEASRKRVAKQWAPDITSVSTFLDSVVKKTPAAGTPGGCGKCVWSREGGVFEGVAVSPKEFNTNHIQFGACDNYDHGVSQQQLYKRAATAFPNGTAAALKVLVREYMDARGAVMLGKSEEEKALEEGRQFDPNKRKSENGVPMYQYPSGLRVSVGGTPCRKTAAPHHHRVYQGYQLCPVAGASRKRPRVETAVESDSDSPSDSDSD
jgi:hypothetical protein